ncbi:hypothetical protein LB545_30735, partial [Mesorhizobium sp. BR1-1-6]|uniref:hypothetical protein n=1 Tax=Mesorhizobium sp. BR1-1-6 TaxID=2876648 RepID=UPI001CD06D8D
MKKNARSDTLAGGGVSSSAVAACDAVSKNVEMAGHSELAAILNEDRAAQAAAATATLSMATAAAAADSPLTTVIGRPVG